MIGFKLLLPSCPDITCTSRECHMHRPNNVNNYTVILLPISECNTHTYQYVYK